MPNINTLGYFPKQEDINANGVSNQERPTWDASSLVGQFASGYLEGLTTFDLLKDVNGHPDTIEEQISRSFGSVLGFVGFGWGSLAKVGYSTLSGSMKLMGRVARSAEYTEKGLKFAQKADAIKPLLTSVPAFVGKQLSARTMRVFETSAAKNALKFTEEVVGRKFSKEALGIGESMAESALFMGFASAAGARPLNPLQIFTEDDFSQRWEVFKSSLPMGAFQGGLASAITKKTFERLGVKSFAEIDPIKQDYLLKSMRAVSAGLAMGGYAAAEGYPTELALYETLVNGVFGWRELPWYDKQAMHLMKKHNVHGAAMVDWLHMGDKFLESKGEIDVPTEVSDSFNLSMKTTYGSQIQNIPAIEKALRESLAFHRNVNPEDLPDNIWEEAAKSGEEIKSATANSIFTYNEVLKKTTDALVDDHKKLHKENPDEAAMQEIAERADNIASASMAQRLNSGHTSAYLIQQIARRGQINTEKTMRFMDQLLAYQKGMRETGLSFQATDFTVAIRELLKGSATDPLTATVDVGRIFMANKQAGQKIYEPVKMEVEKKFGITLNEDQDASLRHFWLSYATSKPVEIYDYDPSTKNLGKRPAHRKDGSPQYEMANISPYELITGEKIIKVTNALTKDGKLSSIHNDDINMSELIFNAFKKGLWYISGKKDDHDMRFAKNVELIQNENGNYVYDGREFDLRREMNGIDVGLRSRGVKREEGQAWNEYQADRKRFTDEAGVKNENERMEAESAYDQLFAKNVLFWNKFNGVESLYEQFKDDKSFSITNVFKFNKRTQLLFDSGIQMDKSIAGKDKYSARIVQWSDKTLGTMKDVFDRYMATQEDGVLWVAPEPAEKIGVILGNPKAGFYKASVVAENGFIGKLGIHVMTPAEAKAFKDAGLHEDMFFFESAAKQIGKRDRTTLEWKKDGDVHVLESDAYHKKETSEQEPLVNKASFEFPVESLRLNTSASEDAKMKSIHWVKQLLNHTEEDPALSKHLFDTIVMRSFFGDKYIQDEQQLVKSAGEIEGDVEKELKTNTGRFNALAGKDKAIYDVDLDQVGVPELFNVLAKRPNDVRLEKLIDYLMGHMIERSDEIEADEIELIDQLRAMKTPISELMNAAGKHAYNPAFISQKPVINYLEQALYRVAIQRLQRPGHENSFKAKLGYLSPIEGSLRAKLDDKTILFGGNLREKPVVFNGEKTTLGELWKRVADDPKIKEFFDNVISVRVPLSDLSGARNLKFGGFIDGGGWKVYVHPHNMKYMDGADLDGDSAFLYMGMPKKLTDRLNMPEVRERFSKWYRSAADQKAGKGIGVKEALALGIVDREEEFGWHKDFAVDKGASEHLKGKGNYKFMKEEPIGIFSPFQRALANKLAANGKGALGPGLVAALRAKQVYKYLLANNGQTVKIGNEEYTLRAKPNLDEQRITQFDTVNSSADAADGGNMASQDVVRAANLASVLTMRKKNGQLLSDAEAVKVLSQRHGMKLAMNNIPFLDAITKLDYATKPTTFEGEKKSLGQIMEGLKYSTEVVNKLLPKGMNSINNIWYDSALTLGTAVNYEPTFGSFMNPTARKVVMEIADRFFKDAILGKNNIGRLIASMMGRSGMSFNVSRLDKTKIWNDIIVPSLAGKKAKDGRPLADYYKDNFINSYHYADTELWKYLKDFKVGKNTTDKFQEELLAELGERSLYTQEQIVKYDSTSYTAKFMVRGKEFYKTFDKYGTAERNLKDMEQYIAQSPWVKYLGHEFRERSMWEQVRESDKLVLESMHELTSTLLMNDAVSTMVANKIKNKELLPENVDAYLEKELQTFLNQASSFRQQLIASQQDVISAIGDSPTIKTEKNNYYQKTVDTINKYRNGLSADEQFVFDSTFISALQPNNADWRKPKVAERTDQILAGKRATFRSNSKNLTEDQIKVLSEAQAKAEGEIYEEWLYKGNYASVPFTAGIVNPEVVREYYKRFGMISDDYQKLPSDLKAEDLLNEYNLNPFPVFMTADPETPKMMQRDNNQKVARKFATQFFNDASKEGLDRNGKIKDPVERAYYDRIVEDLTSIFKNHKEILDNFLTVFPYITSLRTKGYEHRAAEFATKQDLEFMIAVFKNDVDKMKSLSVDWKWYAKQMPMIAERLKATSKEFAMFPYVAHAVVPGEGGKPTAMDMTVKSLLGPLDTVTIFGESLSALKNKLDNDTLTTFLKFDTHGLFNKLNKNYNNLSTKLFDIAVSLLEEPLAQAQIPDREKYETEHDYVEAMGDYDKKMAGLAIYKQYADDARKAFDAIEDKPYKFQDRNGTTQSMSKHEIVNYYKDMVYKYQAEYERLLNSNVHDHLIAYTGQKYGETGAFNEVDIDATIANIMGYIQENKVMPQLSKKKLVELAATTILDRTPIDVYTTAKSGIVFGEYTRKKGIEEFQKRLNKRGGSFVKETLYWNKVNENGEKMSETVKHALIDQLLKDDSLFGFSLSEISKPFGKFYFPHITLSQKVKENYLRKKMAELEGLSFSDVQDAKLEVMQYFLGSRSQTYDEQAGQHFFARIMEGKDVFSSMKYKTMHEKGRSDDPMPDWDKSPVALINAHAKLSKETADMLFSVLGNYITHKYRDKGVFGEKTGEVVDFIERYFKQALGFPDLTPYEHANSGQEYGMQKTVFKYASDEYYVRLLERIGNSWFGGKVNGDFSSIERLASKMKFETPEAREEYIARGKRMLAEKKLSTISQLEAKWSLLSLLTSTKTFVTNLASASTMTLINTSFEDWKKGYSLKAMQDELGEHNIYSAADAQRLLAELGGLEGQFQQEIRLHPELNLGISDAIISEFKKNGVNADVQGILAKNGIVERFMDKGAWFMRLSERKARQHSLLAHYFNARRALRQQGFELEWNDPWLIQIARDGVNASQFLYSNTMRPAFMGTAVGKMFHRFQLYAYNSIVFRKNILEQAKAVGIQPGNPAYDRFQRMAVTDMFAMGMASMIPMSIFGAGLMPPYNTLNSLVQFFFGSDEKKKQDAFYGGLPYPLNIMQTVTPPMARGFVGLLNYAYSGDADKLGQSIYSMFPGQRIMKDVWKTYDQIKNKHRNPAIAIDNMTGIPLVNSGNVIRHLDRDGGMGVYLGMYRNRPYSSEHLKTEEDIDNYIRQMSPTAP